MEYQLIDATVAFPDQVAVSHLSLSLKRNQTTVLLGTSGSGKSSVLKSLLGIVSLSNGQLLVDGKPLLEKDILKYRRRIGYFTQGGGLFPHLNVEDNIQILAKYLNWSNQRLKLRTQELMALSKLDYELLKRYPKELSGGQRQRCALMRALFHNPSTLLLDEPLGALDPITRFDLQLDLKEIFDQLKKTVVLVTHDLREAEFFSDQIHILDQGCLIQSGTYSEILQAPANPFVQRFFQAQAR